MAEYVWIDGTNGVRSKTKVRENVLIDVFSVCITSHSCEAATVARRKPFVCLIFNMDKDALIVLHAR